MGNNGVEAGTASATHLIAGAREQRIIAVQRRTGNDKTWINQRICSVCISSAVKYKQDLDLYLLDLLKKK